MWKNHGVRKRKKAATKSNEFVLAGDGRSKMLSKWTVCGECVGAPPSRFVEIEVANDMTM